MSSLPEISIYMLSSIDGYGTGNFLEESSELVTEYFKREYDFDSKAILCGRSTFEEAQKCPVDFSQFKSEKIDRKDYEIKDEFNYYTIVIDGKGKIAWPSGYFCIFEEYGRKQKAQVISILTEDVKDEYLAYLRSVKVSYIFAGKEKVELKVALSKLKNLFGIEKILCEGGPTTNGLLIKEDLVKRLIFFKCPFLASPGGKPVFGEAKLSRWELESLYHKQDTLILSYVKK